MEALIASYGDSSSDSDSDSHHPTSTSPPTSNITISRKTTYKTGNASVAHAQQLFDILSVKKGSLDYLQAGQPSRVRSFPHVEGNYALHVYIPVCIPNTTKKETASFIKRVSSRVPGLHVVDMDIPLDVLCKDDQKLEQVALGKEFHISLGRTVPIRVHQIDSVISMLRQRLQSQKRYWIDFSKWEVFVNDDKARSFLSLEVVAGGLAEVTKQIELVNQVYKLHNLPEFYKEPRPHISVAWALGGDISDSLKKVVEEETKSARIGVLEKKSIFTCKFSGIECRIGNKTHKICKFPDEQ